MIARITFFISFVLGLIVMSSLNASSQTVNPRVYISTTKDVFSIGDSVVVTAKIINTSTYDLIWKKNGVSVDNKSKIFKDPSIKSGDIIQCLLYPKEPNSLTKVEISNRITIIINENLIKPELQGKFQTGSPLNVVSNETNRVLWYKDGKQIKNPNPSFSSKPIIAAENTLKEYDLKLPGDIFIDKAGNAYIADTENFRIVKVFKEDSTAVLVAGGNSFSNQNSLGSASNQIYPTDVIVSDDGLIYINNYYGSPGITVWEPGALERKILISGTWFSTFFIKNNKIYAFNNDKSSVERFDINGKFEATIAGNNGKGSALNQFNGFIRGIYVDDNEDLYVSDRGNYRVMLWKKGASSGEIVAGFKYNGVNVGNGPGTGVNVTVENLNNPSGLLMDSERNLLIADGFRVVKWKPYESNGIIIAGSLGGSRGNDTKGLSNDVEKIGLYQNKFLYVCDRWNNRIMKWEIGKTNGELFWGGYNRDNFNSKQILSPYGLTINENQKLIFADNTTDNLLEWDDKNKSSKELGKLLTSNYLDRPKGFKKNAKGDIFIANSFGYKIDKLSYLGNGTYSNSISTVAGGNGKGNAINQLNFTIDIAIDENDNLYIYDWDGKDGARVIFWKKDAKSGEVIISNSTLNYSFGAIESGLFLKNNSLYICDNSGNGPTNKIESILKYDILSKKVSIVAGGNGWGNLENQLTYPTSIFVDDEESIFVVDNNRIQQFKKDSNKGVTILGSSIGTSGNSLGLLKGARYIFQDPLGDIYVSDTGNSRILRISKENNNSYTPSEVGNYYAKVLTKFGEFSTPIYKVTAPDNDKDGIEDALDKCPNTPTGEQVDSNGCSLSQKDTDNDGINDKIDKCSNSKTGFKVDSNGCADYQKDSDNDGITDDIDKCQGTPSGIKVDTFGCSDAQKDTCSNVKPTIILKNGLELSTPLLGVGYNWYLNEIKIPNVNTSSYLATSSGRYSVQVLKTATCITGVSENIFVQITGTNEENNQFIVFPNPFTKDIKIEFPPEYGSTVKVSISDIKGSVVYSKERVINSEILNLSNLSSGSYFLSIIDKDSLLKKLIKLIKE